MLNFTYTEKNNDKIPEAEVQTKEYLQTLKWNKAEPSQ